MLGEELQLLCVGSLASGCGMKRKSMKQGPPAYVQQDWLVWKTPGLVRRRLKMLGCRGLLDTPIKHLPAAKQDIRLVRIFTIMQDRSHRGHHYEKT
jgi:hypothetical protein